MRWVLSTIRCHGVLLAYKLRAFSSIYHPKCMPAVCRHTNAELLIGGAEAVQTTEDIFAANDGQTESSTVFGY